MSESVDKQLLSEARLVRLTALSVGGATEALDPANLENIHTVAVRRHFQQEVARVIVTLGLASVSLEKARRLAEKLLDRNQALTARVAELEESIERERERDAERFRIRRQRMGR